MRSRLTRALPPLLGFAAGVLLMLALRSPPELAGAPAAVEPGHADPLEASELRDLPELVEGPPLNVEPAAEPKAEPEAPERTNDLAQWYRLMGTAAASDTGKARAILVNTATGETSHVSVGQLLEGAEVIEISSRRVQLLHPDGEISELRGSTGSPPPSEAPAPAQEIAPGASFIDHLASSEPGYIRERFGGDFVAHYESGKLLGWLVAPDPEREPGAVVDAAGLGTGDRIVGLNGLDLTDPATLEFLNQIPVPFDELIFRVVDLEGRERVAYERGDSANAAP